MYRKSQKFQELWAPEGQQLEGLQSLFADIRERVAEEPLPPLSGEQLRAAGRSMKQAAAMGADRPTALDIDRLPDTALEELAVVLAACEACQ
eukprot:7420626-Pyramimonas_sp.AAC.1